jgi:AcrR family transcriptional regulator
MRRIAAELGSAAMSLYRHVYSKDDLLDLMLDMAFGEIALPEHPSGDWQADLRLFAHTTHAALKLHPWLIPLLTSRPTLGPNYLRWFEFALATVSGLGLEMKTMMRMFGAIYAYVTGATGYELAEEENTRRTGLSEEDKHRYATPYVQQVIAGGRYPNFARFFEEGTPADADRNFAFGLDCLLEGLAACIESQTFPPASDL